MSTGLLALPRLMFISAGDTAEAQLHGIRLALDHGVQFIQVRWKNANIDELEALVHQAFQTCKSYHALCIVNDFPTIANSLHCSGVHMGLNDGSVIESRKLLGFEKIIGGTANTLADVNQRIQEKCDYIGLGPYRFTSTKAKLSPILGLRGYREIIAQLESNHIPPIYAIGGIQLNDVEQLRASGIYGVSMSSYLLKNHKQIPLLNQYLYG